MTVRNIKAILFDLDGTLHHHAPSSADVFTDFARGLGYRISEEDKIRAEHWTHYYFANSPEIKKDGRAYHDDKKAFWDNFCKRWLVALGLPLTDAAEHASKSSAHLDETHHPQSFVPQDAFPMLEYFKSAGYILGVVSNRDKPYAEKLKELGLDSYFQFAVAGGEVKSHKPDRIIFEHALNLAGTSAAETMYIGDNYFADVIGARRVGIAPILYDPAELFFDPGCAAIKSFTELPILLRQ